MKKSLYIVAICSSLSYAGLITHNDYTGGNVITAAGQNTNENAIVNEFNGNINSANIAALGITNSNIANATLTLSKHAVGSFGFPSVATKVSTYTVTVSDDLLLVDASSTLFSLTLPSPATLTGKVFIFKRIDNTLANAITIKPFASETIDGYSTRTLMTKNEEWKLTTDGTNWYSVDHVIASTWTAYSPGFGAGYGVVTSTNAFYKRVGDTLWVRGDLVMGTPTAAVGTITIPTGLNIDANKMNSNKYTVGTFIATVGGTTVAPVTNGGLAFLHFDGTNTGWVEMGDQMTTSAWQSRNVSGVYANAALASFEFSVPIVNWNE